MSASRDRYARRWIASLLTLTMLGLITGCSPEVSVSEPSDNFPQMRTYTLGKSALPSSPQSWLHNVRLWASTVRNDQRALSEESVALMLLLSAPSHQIDPDSPVTLTIDQVAHRYDDPFYDGGMRYGDEIRETVGLDLPFPLFQSLAHADSASLTLGNDVIALPHSSRKGLRKLVEQLQSGPL